MTAADALLAGPRGRRMLLEYAMACAQLTGTDDSLEASSTLWRAAGAYDDSGTVILFGRRGDAAPAAPDAASPADAAAALDSIALGAPAPAMLRDALAASVDAAMYWQAPDGSDRLCATAEVRASLRRVAEAVAGSSGAQWWFLGVAEDDQWAVPWEGAGLAPPDAAAELRAWRESTLADEESAAIERPADAAAAWSGRWWSTPPSSLVRTTRSLGADGPAGLWFVEDSFGETAAEATPVEVFPARVIEIDGPDAWAQLCRRHPLDVTASRRHDWFRVTDRDGRWVMPDWEAVAAETDAVHLTVAGHLSTATRLIEVDGERSSVLAGWNPDETFWFRATSARPAAAQSWRREDDAWKRVTG